MIIMTRDSVLEIVKYADDTAIVGLISQNEFNYRSEVINFEQWCKHNFVHLNTSKRNKWFLILGLPNDRN